MRRRIALLVLATMVALSLGAQDGSTGSGGADAGGADPALVALGAVGISNLYFGYVSLASVADGYASGAYTAATATSLAEESIAFHRTARRALRGLLDGGGVAEAERPILQRMIDAHGLLINEAQGLVTFVSGSGDSENFRRYRDQAWTVISELLASEDEEVSAPPAGTPGD